VKNLTVGGPGTEIVSEVAEGKDAVKAPRFWELCLGRQKPHFLRGPASSCMARFLFPNGSTRSPLMLKLAGLSAAFCGAVGAA
jgi:hypothetical protein